MNFYYNEDGKCLKDYKFDKATNALADPKLNYLQESFEVYQNFLKNQLLDVGYTDALKVKAAEQNPDNCGQPKIIPALRKQKSLNNLKIACKRKTEHENLILRVEKMKSVIQRKKEDLKECQVKFNNLSLLLKLICPFKAPTNTSRFVLLQPPHRLPC